MVEVMSNRAYEVYDWDQEPDLDELRRLMDMQATDPAQALGGLEELAGRGSTMSMVYLAHAYRNGIGVNVDYDPGNGSSAQQQQATFSPPTNSAGSSERQGL